MSSAAINRFEWVKAVTQSGDLVPVAKNIATALALEFANEETGQLNPSMSTLADYVKVSVRTVKRAIKSLADAGWLARTEGRGRGNSTSYSLQSPGKIIRFSAQKKGVTTGPLTREKVTAVVTKGVTGGPSHYKDKQSLEQRARGPSDKPSPHLQFVVHHGSFHEDNWNAWLEARKYPPLREIGERGSDGGGTGWIMPQRSPPNADGTAMRVAEKRVWWLINRANQRAGLEVRYAGE